MDHYGQALLLYINGTYSIVSTPNNNWRSFYKICITKSIIYLDQYNSTVKITIQLLYFQTQPTSWKLAEGLKRFMRLSEHLVSSFWTPVQCMSDRPR